MVKELVFYDRKNLERRANYRPPSKNKQTMGSDGRFHNEDLKIRFGTPHKDDPDEMIYFDFGLMDTYNPSIFTNPTIVDDKVINSVLKHRFVLILTDTDNRLHLKPEAGDIFYEDGIELPRPIRERRSVGINSPLSYTPGETIRIPEKGSLVLGRGLAITTPKGYRAIRATNPPKGKGKGKLKSLLGFIGLGG